MALVVERVEEQQETIGYVNRNSDSDSDSECDRECDACGLQYRGLEGWKIICVTCMSVVPTDLNFCFKNHFIFIGMKCGKLFCGHFISWKEMT